MPYWRNSDSMPKVRASSGMIGTTYLPMLWSFSSSVSTRTKAMVVETSLPCDPPSDSANSSTGGAWMSILGTTRAGKLPPMTLLRSWA